MQSLRKKGLHRINDYFRRRRANLNYKRQFLVAVQNEYEIAKTFHDGKWVMFPLDGSVGTAESEQDYRLKES